MVKVILLILGGTGNPTKWYCNCIMLGACGCDHAINKF